MQFICWILKVDRVYKTIVTFYSMQLSNLTISFFNIKDLVKTLYVCMFAHLA